MDAKAIHAEAKERYWKEHDLAAARKLLEQGIATALEVGNLSEAKAMNYNLASFCWPGWDEPGIVITLDDLAAGERAAQENLRLAIELGKGDRALGNAWFMIGGYHLANGRYDASLEAYEEYGTNLAFDPAFVLSAAGFVCLTLGLMGREVKMDESIKSLRDLGSDDAVEFANQLVTACRVFGVPCQ